MKRKGRLRNVIALALMLGMGCMGTAEAAINLGDVDGSGVVDMRDIDALEKYLQTGNSRFLASSKNADVNLDNRIDREDLRLLKQRVYYPGDVNGDNLVDDRDIRAAKEYMATGQYNYLADLSNDGTVTLQDYTSVRDLVDKSKSIMKGDLNGDGNFSISDVALIDMYIKGLTKNINRLAADMNNDGRIDSTDKKIILDKFFNVSRYAPDGEITSLYSPSAHVIVVEGSVWDNDDLNRDIVVQVNAGPNASDSKQFTVPGGSKSFSQKISFPNVSGVQTVNVYALDAGENRKDKLLKSAEINFNNISRYAPDGEITSLYSPSAHEIVVEGSVWDNDDLNRDIVVQVNVGPNASDSKQFTVPRGSKRFSQKMSFPNVSGVQTVNVYALDVGENRKDKLLKSSQIDFKGTSQVEKYVVTTNGATLALRSGPGTNYGIRARMPRGSVVEVYSINNGWAKLSYNGMSGYASAQYLQKKPYYDDMEEQVKSRINQLYNTTGYRVNSKFTGSGECRGFASKVYQTLFSVGRVSGYTDDNFGALNYQGSYIVGSAKKFSSNDIDTVRNLFYKAKPGAFIQMGRRNKLNSNRTAAAPHSAILVYVDGNGAMFYEANADGRNTIKNNYYTWAQLAARNIGFTLYLPDAYRLR